MKSILMSDNIDKANEFIAELEEYVKCLSLAKASMQSIGIKNASSEMLMKAITGDFGPFLQACAQLIEEELQGVTNPVLRAHSMRVFDEGMNRAKSVITAMSGTVAGYKYGDPYLDQYLEWKENDVPFIPEPVKSRIYENFSTFVRRDRELLYKKHHQASEALDSFLQELYKAKLTTGVGIAPMLYLFNYFIVKEEGNGYVIKPKPFDYNYVSDELAEVSDETTESES
jgi:hypothetical protein